MKNLLVSLLLLPSITFAQERLAYGKTKADYEKVFKKFVKFYNNCQVDSLKNIMSDELSDSRSKLWTEHSVKKMRSEFGKVVSCKYIGPFEHRTDTDSNIMAYFKVVFDRPAQNSFSSMNGKKEHAACISLDKKDKILGMGFLTSAPEIDSLISKY